MTREPYASAHRVFWIVDNGSSHHGQPDRPITSTIPQRDPGAPPVHASWLNQVEIYFSIVQRKCARPNDFTDLDALTERLAAFENRYNQTATPFNWTYTRDDLSALLGRSTDTTRSIPQHTPPDPRRTYDHDH